MTAKQLQKVFYYSSPDNKEFIESNINVNTHKHQLHKQKSQGIKTQIDCVSSNKIKSHKQKNKYINTIHTHSNIQKGNH